MKLASPTGNNLYVGRKSRQEILASPWFFGLLLGLIVVGSFSLRLTFLHNLRWTYDEGIHVLFAQLAARGYEPYADIFVSYPPLYTLSLSLTWQLFGTVESLQILMALYTMTGLIAVGLLAWRLGGVWPGVLAPIFLSFEPEFFWGSRAIMTEVPSISLATLAVTLAAYYLWGRGSGRGWLIASGLVLAASLMLKLLTPYVAGLIGLMILGRQLHLGRRPTQPSFWRGLILDGLLWGLALLIPIIALSLPYHLPAMLDQAILFRLASRDPFAGEDSNVLLMLSFLGRNWVISLLAVVGLGFIVRRQFQLGWFVVAWLGVAGLFTLMQVPLRDKHLPLLLPPLAILAGLGLNWLWVGSQQRQWRLAGASLGLALLLIYGWQTQQTFAGYSSYQRQYLNESDQVLVDFIRRFTAPTDCLLTDSPTLAFVAERPVPPNLAEASSARLRSGYLTEAMLIETGSRTDCQTVAPIDRRFKRSAPGFIEWSKANYLGLWLYDQETEVLLAKPMDQAQPQTRLQANLGQQVELVGFDWSALTGQSAYLSLYWRTLQPFDQDYTVFVHLRDGANNTLANADHQPYAGHVPTSRWPVNKIVKETIRLDLPADVPVGDYRLLVGLYSPSTLERLPVQTDLSGENAVILPNLPLP